MKLILLVFIFFSIETFAANRLLKKQNIIDIGHNQESREIEVPKEKIIKEPNIRIMENKTVYAKRIQSQKYDCETDFLGTETCSQEQTVCPSTTDYVDGYSIAHHVKKQYLKICSPWDIQEGGRCYPDKDNNRLKDSFRTVTPASSTTSVYFWCNAGYYVKQGTGWDNYGGCGGAINWAVNYSETQYYCDGIESQSKYCVSNSCPAGYSLDGENCYKKTFCPNGTVEQSDGTCLMEYDWYSYLCPTDTNEYGEPWRVIYSGSDCGDASCTNSATPPVNNCARVHYTCPTDPNMKCGKTQNEIGFCQDGYVWNNNRCERVEKFCGSSFYNATLDICQDITRYTKLCKEYGEVYDKIKNKCVSSVTACENGVYSETYNKCMMDFVADCNSSGYVYNPASDVCENKTKPLCKTQYNFDSTRSICVGEMAVCSTGYTYNADTNKCEKELCGILGTDNNDTRCITQPLCDGVLTPEGACIPNTLK